MAHRPPLPVKTTSTRSNRQVQRLSFSGLPNEDVTAFLQEIARIAFENDHVRDEQWIMDYTETCLTGQALFWYSSLSEETQGSWRKLRHAMLHRYANLSGMVPDPAPAAAPPPSTMTTVAAAPRRTISAQTAHNGRAAVSPRTPQKDGGNIQNQVLRRTSSTISKAARPQTISQTSDRPALSQSPPASGPNRSAMQLSPRSRANSMSGPAPPPTHHPQNHPRPTNASSEQVQHSALHRTPSSQTLSRLPASRSVALLS